MKKLLAPILALVLALLPILSLAADGKGSTAEVGSLSKTVITLAADEAGCSAAFGSQDGPKWAELLNKTVLTTWSQDRYQRAVLTMGSATALDQVMDMDLQRTLIRTSLLKRPLELQTEDAVGLLAGTVGLDALTSAGGGLTAAAALGLLSAVPNVDFSSLKSWLKEDADLLSLASDLGSVKWNLSATIDVLAGILNNAFINSNDNGWKTYELVLSPDTARDLVNALAQDLPMCDGLERVVNTYFSTSGFSAWIGQLKADGLDLVDRYLQSDLKVSYRTPRFADGLGLGVDCTLKENGSLTHYVMSFAYTATTLSVSVSVTDPDSGEGDSFTLDGNSVSGTASCQWLQLKSLNGVLAAEKKLAFTLTGSGAALTQDNEEQFNLSWDLSNGLTVTGTVKGEPITLSFSFDTEALTVTVSFSYKEDSIRLVGDIQDTKDGTTCISFHQGDAHVFDLTAVTTDHCDDAIDWAALMGDTSNPWDVGELLTDAGAAEGLYDELADGLWSCWQTVCDEIPVGILSSITGK